MTTEEYIASGVLESYVMGELSDKEMQKVQCMALVHDEISEELSKIELAFEKMSIDTAESPTAGLKSRIWKDISTNESDDSTPLIPMNDGASEAPGISIKWSRAASIAALLGLGILSYTQYQNSQDIEQQLSSLQAQVDDKDKELSGVNSQLASLEQDLSIIKDPTFTEVELVGTDNAPSYLANVYWNPSLQDVYLSVGRMEELPAGKVYQLWALNDGVPVDAGTFVPQDSLIKMKAISEGQAFAVTIEDEGGAESPALETLQVIGEVPA